MSVSNPRTKAEAARRQRRDIVSGEVMEEDRLIRFVAGPEGTVVPDLARKLPGRGLWVAATREAVEMAANKGLFSRAAKAKLNAPVGLADKVEGACCAARILDLAGLGLAKRAGDLILGFEKVRDSAIRDGKVAWLVEAADGSEDGRGKLLGLVRHARPRPGLIGRLYRRRIGFGLGAG